MSDATIIILSALGIVVYAAVGGLCATKIQALYEDDDHTKTGYDRDEICKDAVPFVGLIWPFAYLPALILANDAIARNKAKREKAEQDAILKKEGLL